MRIPPGHCRVLWVHQANLELQNNLPACFGGWEETREPRVKPAVTQEDQRSERDQDKLGITGDWEVSDTHVP